MRLLKRLLAYLRVLPKGKRNSMDATKYIVRMPAVAGAMGAYELAVLLSNRVDTRAKYLATSRVSSLVGCPV